MPRPRTRRALFDKPLFLVRTLPSAFGNGLLIMLNGVVASGAGTGAGVGASNREISVELGVDGLLGVSGSLVNGD